MKKFLTLLLFATLCFGVGWADEYSYTFTKGVFSANGTQNLGSVSWTLAGDGGYWGYDNTKGQQFGSSGSPYTSLTLSTTGISGTIQSVKVNASTASSATATMTISVGGIRYLSNQSLTSSVKEYNGNGSSSGTIVISITQTTRKALYIKSITVTYTTGSQATVEVPTLTNEFTFWPVMNDPASAQVTITPAEGNTVRYTTNGSTPSRTNGTEITAATIINISGTTTVKAISYVGTQTSSVVSKTYTLGQTVTGVSAFKNLTSGTTVRLYLPDNDNYNARVTHVESNGNGTVDAYIRDNTGAMRMTGISPNRPMAYNQHLAGWITGKYTVGSDGIPQFEPAEDLTNTAFFVIADPVTESDTKPVEINSNQVGDHLADWVTIKDVTVDSSIDNTKFNLDYSAEVYNGALVDVDAIAANGKLYPVNDDNGYPITFVVDASKSFVSPHANINDVKIRLKRTLSASNWNFLTVPFDIYESDFDGEVLEYKGVELGKVGEYIYRGQVYDITGGIMKFEPYSGTIFAGKPYLVKPASAVAEQTFMETTLSKSAPSVVKYSISAAQGAMGIGTMENTTPVYVGDYSLVGTYEPTTLPKNESTVMLDGNEISWTSLLDDTDVNATEAYITIPDGAGVKLDLGSNGTVTAINNVMIHNENASEQVIYNLMGVRLTRPLGELPPGVYIVNGKKIVKR